MKRIRYRFLVPTALLLALPALAADEPPATGDAPAATPAPADSEGDTGGSKGWFYGEISEWFAQPVGTEYRWATVSLPSDSRGVAVQSVSHGTSLSERWRAGWIFKDPKLGRILVTYWSHADEEYRYVAYPGDFIIGESATLPTYAGVFDDGFADIGEVGTSTKTRDTRIDYGWTLVKNRKMEVQGLVGWRWIDHARTMDTRYYGFGANIPAVGGAASPRDDLVPLPDVALVQSDFSARGLDIGLEASFFLHPRVSIDASLSMALLRGATNSSYSWSNAYYVIQIGTDLVPVPPDQLEALLDNPVTEPFVFQTRTGGAIHDDGASETSWMAEASVAIRGQVHTNIDVFGGFRASHYDRVGADLRSEPDGPGWTRTTRSVGYEGFFFGLAFRY